MKVRWPQTWFTCAGDSSCYADCIIRIACDYNGIEMNLKNIGHAFDVGIDNGHVTFNRDVYRDEKNFTVTNPCGWLKDLTGKEWTVSHEKRDYRPIRGEIEVQFWALSESDGAHGIGHFVLPDWCPTQHSKTLRDGFIYSKRIFRRK